MTDKTKVELPPEVKGLVDNAKKDGHAVFALNISGTKYYYRSINRAEFRSLQEKLTQEAEKLRDEMNAQKKGLKEGDPQIAVIESNAEKQAAEIRDRGEERLVGVGLLYPPIGPNTPAGVLTTVADRIMQASGYGNEDEPEVL